MNLVLYADESGTHDRTGNQPQSQVAVMAGYVARCESWIKFHRDWGALLKKYSVPYFHFTELQFARRVVEKSGTPIHSQHKNPYLGWSAQKCSDFLMDAAGLIAGGSRIPVCGDADTWRLASARNANPNIKGPKNPQKRAAFIGSTVRRLGRFVEGGLNRKR